MIACLIDLVDGNTLRNWRRTELIRSLGAFFLLYQQQFRQERDEQFLIVVRDIRQIAGKATTLGVLALRSGAKDRVLQHARHHILGALGPTRIRMLFTLLRNQQFDALVSCYFLMYNFYDLSGWPRRLLADRLTF